MVFINRIKYIHWFMGVFATISIWSDNENIPILSIKFILIIEEEK